MSKDESTLFEIRSLLVVVVTLAGVMLFGCAQVPKESVELSTTVGRDISKVYDAHHQLAVILYNRMKDDVNAFVDEVYAPYQIQKLLAADYEDFKSGRDGLFWALDRAIKAPDAPKAQTDAVEYMRVFAEVVRLSVESYREKRLAPLLAQEEQLLAAIDRSYRQIHYANSIVTGHLASIVRVHDAQDEVLEGFAMEGLREDAGKHLADTAREVGKLVGEAKKAESKAAVTSAQIEEWAKTIDAMFGPNEN